MTAREAPAAYGRKELNALHHRYTYEGLALAIILHFLIVGIYYALLPVLADEVVPYIFVTPTFHPLPPPSISDNPMLPFGNPVLPPSVSGGIPVPVPDPVIIQDQP